MVFDLFLRVGEGSEAPVTYSYAPVRVSRYKSKSRDGVKVLFSTDHVPRESLHLPEGREVRSER